MARVDSILSILVHQGANELRLGTDREPKLFASGTPRRLSIPGTPESTLRALLGEILDPPREEVMRARGHVELLYESGGMGAYDVRITARAGGGFDAVFLRHGGAPAAAPAPAIPARPPISTPAPTVASSAPAASSPAGAPARSREPFEPLEPRESGGLPALVAAARALRASDLHLVGGHAALARVDGRLRPIDD